MDILYAHTNVAPSAPDTEKMARDERAVTSGFWPKIRATLGKVPFTEDAVAGYYCATDRSTPTYVRAVLFGALAYFVIPTDLIPDFIVGLGFTDDATVLMAAFAAVRAHFTPEHRSRARRFLMGGDQPDS
ncbi:MAG: YkvA family protein [Proteobacteria bacterium]|nr:YkvA family protein [Pseudomonadota bacterium]